MGHIAYSRSLLLIYGINGLSTDPVSVPSWWKGHAFACKNRPLRAFFSKLIPNRVWGIWVLQGEVARIYRPDVESLWRWVILARCDWGRTSLQTWGWDELTIQSAPFGVTMWKADGKSMECRATVHSAEDEAIYIIDRLTMLVSSTYRNKANQRKKIYSKQIEGLIVGFTFLFWPSRNVFLKYPALLILWHCTKHIKSHNPFFWHETSASKKLG